MHNCIFKNFVKLNKQEGELILKWRNSDRIRKKMNNQTIITLETHLKWIKSLSTREDCQYFLFYVDTIPVGVFDLTNINFDKKECFGGSYIGNTDYIGFGIVQCFYSFFYAFEKCNIEKFFANVLKTNKRVYKMHKQIFNAIDISQNEKEYLIYWDKNIWEKNKQEFEKQLKKIYELENVEWIY